MIRPQRSGGGLPGLEIDFQNNAVSRFKASVGVTLAPRTLERQRVEVLVKGQALNWMVKLGMPRWERVPVG